MESKDNKGKGKFRNLKDISSPVSSSESLSGRLLEVPHSEREKNAQRERRSLPRLSLSSEQFRESATGKLFSVTDLSESGMGLWLSEGEEMRHFTVAEVLTGALNLRRDKFPVQARIRSLQSDRLGCEWIQLSEFALKGIQQYLNPHALGAALKLIPSVELNTIWYHGPSETDLWVTYKSGNHPQGSLQSIALHALGSFVQWSEGEGLTTGRTAPCAQGSEIRGIHRLETRYMDRDGVVDLEKLGIAKKVVLSSNLPSEMKSKVVRPLESI